jgi:hypothetical protein
LEDMTDVLVEHCQQHLLFPELLSEIREFNPRQYNRYSSKLTSSSLLRQLDLEPELRSLGRQGFVVKDGLVPGGWRVRPQVFLWWLANELARATRSQGVFQEWLQSQSLDGILTPEERRQLNERSRGIGEMFPGGVTDLIEVTVTGSGQ